jgi:hypothetical protein
MAQHAPVVSELRREMDVLHTQLEEAFEEVVGRIRAIEGRFDDLARALKESAPGRTDTAPPVDLAPIEDALHDLRGLVERSSAVSRAQIEPVLLSLDEGLEDVLGRLDPLLSTGAVTVTADLGPLEARIDELTAFMDQRLGDEQLQIEHDLAAIHRVLRTVQQRPLTVDTRDMEEAARRASLPNAAELATVRQEIALLTDLMHQQQSSLSELRASLELIKARVLG